MKIIHILCLAIFLASCNEYSRENYPQTASIIGYNQHINSCYSAEFDNLNSIPSEMLKNINSFFKNRLGNSNFQKLVLNNVTILSDKPIKIENSKNEDSLFPLLVQEKENTPCDSLLAYPIYSVLYILKIPEIGIKEVGLSLLIDKNGKTIKDIQFPKREFSDKIIPIDSVHSELIRRKIPRKKLAINLVFDKKNKTFVWSTKTLIQEGSILGPSCFPVYQDHFKMDAITGKITEFNFENHEGYFDVFY